MKLIGASFCVYMSSHVLGCQEVCSGVFSTVLTKILDKLFGQPNKSFEIGTVILCILEMARQEQMLFKY